MVSVAEEPGLSLTLSETPKTGLVAWVSTCNFGTYCIVEQRKLRQASVYVLNEDAQRLK